MGKTIRKVLLTYALTTLTVILVDLFTKNLAQTYLSKGELTVLPFLHLVLIYNKGVAFGFLSNAPDFVRLPVLLLTPVLALVVTFVYSLRAKSSFEVVLMGMIGGGAMGNLYDRAFLGSVRDFIYLSYGPFSWPAFNLADASISLAVALFLAKGLFSGKK